MVLLCFKLEGRRYLAASICGLLQWLGLCSNEPRICRTLLQKIPKFVGIFCKREPTIERVYSSWTSHLCNVFGYCSKNILLGHNPRLHTITSTHARTRTHTHTHTHTRARAHTYAHTHTHTFIQHTHTPCYKMDMCIHT